MTTTSPTVRSEADSAFEHDRTDRPISPHAVAARLVDATKTYGAGSTTVTALDRVTVDFAAGRFTSIMGASGSGKSTLLHCAAALDDLTSGQAWVGANELSTLNDRGRCRLRRREIGFVFQAFNLVPTLTAKENITLPLDLDRRRVDTSWFDHVTGAVGITERLAHRPHELSGGQQQRVAVARALLARPAVVFADEPTGNLDSASGREVLSLLRRAVDDFEQTIVMVTHDPAAASVSDEVLFMADGRIRSRLEAPTTTSILDHLGDGSGR